MSWFAFASQTSNDIAFSLTSETILPLANHIAITTFLASILNTNFEVNRLRIFSHWVKWLRTNPNLITCGFDYFASFIEMDWKRNVEILQSFVRHRSDRIRDFVRPNKILSDRTFFHKAYTFDHIIILGLNICIYCSKTNGQSDISKIQCYYCSSVTCHVVVPAKAKHDVEMDVQTDDVRNDLYFSDTL